MKTAMIARFVLGAAAIFAAAGLAGCGAENGQGASEEIGSTSAALSVANVGTAANMTISATDYQRAFAQSCVINSASDGSGPNYLVVIGGATGASPAYASNALLFDPATGAHGTWYGPVSFSGIIANGISKGAAITRPGSTHKNECLFFGGENSAKSDVILSLVYTTDGMGNPSLTITQAGKLSVARSKLAVAACDADKVLIAGGDTGAGASNLLEVWAATTGTNTVPKFRKSDDSGDVTLNSARYDFALAQSGPSHIVLAGGIVAGNPSDTIEGIKTDAANCRNATTSAKVLDITGDSTAATANLGASAVTPAPRTLLGGFYLGALTSPAREQYIFAGGDNSGAKRGQDTITIDWATDSNSVGAYNSTGLPVATKGPAYIQRATGQAIFVGGDAVNEVQTYSAGWSNTHVHTDTSNLVNRYGATGQILGGVFYAAGGFDGSNYLKTVEAITP